jgi:hypothetical protein
MEVPDLKIEVNGCIVRVGIGFSGELNAYTPEGGINVVWRIASTVFYLQ